MSEWEKLTPTSESDGWEKLSAPKANVEAPTAKNVVETATRFAGGVSLLGDNPVTGALREGAGALVGGAYETARQAYAGVTGLVSSLQTGKDRWLKNPGMTFPEAFSYEYNERMKDLPSWFDEVSPTGKPVAEAISHVIEAGLGAYGEVAFEIGRPLISSQDIGEFAARRKAGVSADSPAAGAIAQGMGMLATLGVPLGAKGKPAPTNPISRFKLDYPAAAIAFDATQVGKIKKTIESPTESIDLTGSSPLKAIETAIDNELGIIIPDYTVDAKLRLLVGKLAPEMPMSQQIQLANAYATRFKEIETLFQEDIAARNPPQLPSTALVAMGQKRFDPAQRAAALEGEYLPADKGGPEVILQNDGNRPALPAPGKSVGDNLIVDPEGKVYTGPVRRQLDEYYRTEYARFQEWQKEAETLSGKPVLPKQRGIIDFEGMQINLPEQFKTLEDAAAKSALASYALTKKEQEFFKKIDYQTWEDFTNYLPSGRLKENTLIFDAAEARKAKDVVDYINDPATQEAIGGIDKPGIKGSVRVGADGRPVPSQMEMLKSQQGWVKAPGGAWHPETKDILSESLHRGYKRQTLWGGEQVDAAKTQIDRMLINWLNKYAGTEKDPIKDVRIDNGYGNMLRIEDLTDEFIVSGKAKNFKDSAPLGIDPTGMSLPESIRKAPDDADIWHLDSQNEIGPINAEIRFRNYLQHVGDYLAQHVDPKDLIKYDLPRAVKETVKWDADMAKKAEAEAAKASKNADLGTVLHKQYPDGMKWVEIGGKDMQIPENYKVVQDSKIGSFYVEKTVDNKVSTVGGPYYKQDIAESVVRDAVIEDALNHEGNTMGHCVGGYCQDVIAGETKIYSLRDSKGKSHVTVEVQLPQEGGGGASPYYKITDPAIVQIKGKQNRAPVDQYLPYVQDFVKTSGMKVKGDLQNTKLHEVEHHQRNQDLAYNPTGIDKSVYVEPPGSVELPKSLVNTLGSYESVKGAINTILAKLPDGYYTEAELRKVLADNGVISKQAGMITMGPGKDPIKISEPFKDAAGKAWAVPSRDSAESANRAMAAKLEEMNKTRAMTSKELLKSGRRSVVAHDYDLQAMAREAGPEGKAVQLQINIQPNATMAAKARSSKSMSNIYDDIGKDRELLEKIVALRRIVEIDKNRGVGKVDHGVDPTTREKLTGEGAHAALLQMQKELGPKFQTLDSKASAVFGEEKVNLLRLVEEDLMSVEDYAKFHKTDYTQTEYLKAIDPNDASGIRRSWKGDEVNLDSKRFLQETVTRVENRIAINRTKKALRELALANPDNGIVVMAPKLESGATGQKPPKGLSTITVMIDGKPQFMWMKEELAAQLEGRNNPLDMNVGDFDFTWAQAARVVSGSALLRATATTYNPGFILAGLPMDILHLYLTGEKYSPHLPKYVAEIGRDLAATAKDAFMRTGRWDVAMEEGLGPTFLTHESRAGSKTATDPKFQKIRTALSFFGDFQDMWVRLAHRERLIREGYDSPTATAMAVERLNYYRGGNVTKILDTVLPYTNIAVNATSKVVEAGARDLKGMMWKAGYLIGTTAAMVEAAMIMAPETWKNIPAEDKVKGWNITFGDQAFVIDPNGTKRYFYVPLRIDQTMTPAVAATVGALEKAEYGKAPEDLFKHTFNQVSPLGWDKMFIPTQQAFRAYMDNYDPKRDHPIYNGPNIKPEDQIRNVSKGNPTSLIAQQVGAATGMSPMGLEKAASSLMNTGNPYLQLMGAAYRMMYTTVTGEPLLNPREQAMSFGELMLQFPGMKSIVKLTVPGEAEMKEMNKLAQEANSQRKKEIDGLETWLFKAQHGQAKLTDVNKYVEQTVMAAPLEQRDALKKTLEDHAKNVWQVDQVLKHYKASDGIPSKSEWTYMSRMPDTARAQYFYNIWISATDENRRRLMGVANGLQNAGTGFQSQSFKEEFQRQVKLLGTERR